MSDGDLKFKCWQCGEWFSDIPAHWGVSACRGPNLGPRARAERAALGAGVAPGPSVIEPSRPGPSEPSLGTVIEGGFDRKAYKREWMQRKRAAARAAPQQS